MSAASTGASGPELHRAVDPVTRPELFPVRHHAASSSTSCAFRSATWARPRCGAVARAARPGGRRQAGQPGHLLRARGPLRRGGGAAAARSRRARRDRRLDGPRAGPAPAASPTTPSASARAWASAAASRTSRSTSSASTPAEAASWSARARRWPQPRCPDRDELAGAPPAGGRRLRSRPSCARPSRRLPATVRLTGRESGRADLLDAPQLGWRRARPPCSMTGDRVLGGGFIARAERAPDLTNLTIKDTSPMSLDALAEARARPASLPAAPRSTPGSSSTSAPTAPSSSTGPARPPRCRSATPRPT